MKILIVEDSKFSQIITSKLMKARFDNAEITIANNGQELVKMIKEYDEDAKIFVVSADVQKTVKEELEGYGIMAFINKPFDEEKSLAVSEIIKGDIDERG